MNMNKLKTLLKIKQLLSAVEKLGRAQLEDGTEVEFPGESLEVGADLFIVTGEGNIVAPDGEHMLVTGEKVIVENGLVSEILPVEEPMVEPEPSMEPEPVNMESDLAGRVTSLEEKIEQLLSVTQLLSSQLEAKLSALDTKVENTFNRVEKIANSPVASQVKSEEIKLSSNKNQTQTRAQKIISSKL